MRSLYVEAMTSAGKLFLVALLIGVISGAGAAKADVFQVESTPTKFTGTQEKHPTAGGESSDLWQLVIGIMGCTTTTYSGSQAEEGAGVIELTPAISGCSPGLGLVTVDTNGCKYIFHLNPEMTTGTTEISCPAGKEIVWTFGTPTVRGSLTFPPQTGKGGVTYTNIGAGNTRELTMAIKITNLKYSVVEGTGLGKFNNIGPVENGTYEGALRLTAENWAGTSHVGVFLAKDPEPEHVGIYLD